jgi:hypothetical protein
MNYVNPQIMQTGYEEEKWGKCIPVPNYLVTIIYYY